MGIWDRVSGRTRSVLAAGIRSLKPPLAPGYYEELEEVLVSADLGPAMAARLVAGVRARAPRTREEAADALVVTALSLMSSRPRELFPLPLGERAGVRGLSLNSAPDLLLFYGINGAGKTTTIGKLAYRLKQQGHKPMIVAADTYRAAGIEQMTAWAQRAGVEHFDSRGGADPASVVFDGIHAARSRGSDVVLVDTAGRLQTQRNLLEELAKIDRVASKALEGGAYESLLVIDAVLGLTSLVQAREFNRAVPMTGLVLAKLDSSAKGGAVIAIESELGVPVKLAGVGEGIDDLAPFEPEAFVHSLFEA
ncbi:MAG TPA: signal recognition particle-docking protein FtsY [Candidatus Dormibacteraeota bacterium]|nr:signal recognition particle-docking protein FtsY [Candidatus Dormibacteraeota bacterium]